MFFFYIWDFSAKFRKYLNIYLFGNHKDLEQLDKHITLNSTVIDPQKEEMPPKPTLPEKEVDFRIPFRDEKTIQKVNDESSIK